MRLRSRPKMDDPFDGLTAEEVRRIRGMAAANVTPGMEGLAKIAGATAQRGASEHAPGVRIPESPTTEKRKRGRRA